MNFGRSRIHRQVSVRRLTGGLSFHSLSPANNVTHCVSALHYGDTVICPEQGDGPLSVTKNVFLFI